MHWHWPRSVFNVKTRKLEAGKQRTRTFPAMGGTLLTTDGFDIDIRPDSQRQHKFSP